MKISTLKLALGAAIACFSATALAAEADTTYFTIGKLEASSGAAHGFRVYPTGYSLPNLGCTQHDFAEANASARTLHETQVMNRTLMGAFTAGKQVKLHLNGCGVTGRPVYDSVSLERLR